MSRVEVLVADTPARVQAAFEVRRIVFVLEQQVPPELETDEHDAGACHVLALLEDKPVGAGRLVVESPGYAGVDPALGAVGHLGRLAVLAEARGAGIGVALVRAIEQRASEQGLATLVLGAQTHALGFYRGLGYTAYGPEFDDAGIPHRMMRKSL